MKMPTPRGPVSSILMDILATAPQHHVPALARLGPAMEAAAGVQLMDDDDLQLALFCLYELHYGGIEGVDDRWEWHPELTAFRLELERRFEGVLRRMANVPDAPPPIAADVAAALFKLTGDDDGPSVSKYVAREATAEQLREFLIHRSVYQLKEADPHSWAIPRLTGRAKAALVEIQADEYGGGRPERMHSALFARSMRGLGLDDQYGTYVDLIPAVTLASVNMMSLFGLNRRLRGAIVGHLAAYEMTSSIPNKFYSRGFRRHGHGEDVTGYFDEHVEADAVHEQIAGRDLAGGLAEAEPNLLPDILFGAAAALAVDALVGTHQLSAWQAGRSSLRIPLDLAA
ncbi:iron-containing redox enzyme family protein [Arthrobacter sp. VKM Ac-2550]|uniref:iron-containing redox enzyme family protein n=1 Tax=Crystallibacter permensis TaxID=1938888 RepID=UPI002226845C|nr:iron-containing redox enzyme family protein [Arthrobacter sp. VKM Ac-2550]MCW2134895.1 Iron-containing redox enzyme [Arthrobacter sp. VKM Ac-2550]